MDERERIIRIIRENLESYQRDYEAFLGDHDCELITKSKMVALTQVLNEIEGAEANE